MPSLTSSFNVGSGSASSLVKAASTLTNQLNAYKDAQAKAAFEFDHSDASYQTYSSYLTDRISQLQSTGSIADATKAITMHDQLLQAQSSNASFNITNASIAVMDGQATPQDKLQVITDLFEQSQQTGDVNLSQSLENKAYSLQQTIEQQAQTASDAAHTLAKAQGDKEGSATAAVATQIEQALFTINQGVKDYGFSAFNKSVKDQLDTPNPDTGQTPRQMMQALAENTSLPADQRDAMLKVVNTSQPSYADMTVGMASAMGAYHQLAAQIYMSSGNYSAYQTQIDAAQKIMDGTTLISTVAGNMSLQDMATYQANPDMYTPHQTYVNGRLQTTLTTNSLHSGENAITGMHFDENGHLTASFSGQQAGTQLSSGDAAKYEKVLTSLGLSHSTLKSADIRNGIDVQVTDQSPGWLKNLFGDQLNQSVNMFIGPHGLEFGVQNADGSNTPYVIATDSKGLSGLFKGTNDGKGNIQYLPQQAAGQYGFNQKSNTVTQAAQAAIQKSMGNPTVGRDQSPARPSAQMTQRAGGGFNFTNNGQAISAARYSQITGVPFRTLLQQMSDSGDTGAKTALQFVGNDYGYDASKQVSYQNSSTYNALTWGAGVKAAPSTIPASALGNGAQLKF